MSSRSLSCRYPRRDLPAAALALLLGLLLAPTHVHAQPPAGGLQDLRDAVTRKDYRGVQSRLERWVKAHPDDGEAWELLGRCREGRWMFDQAADAYRRALEIEGERADLLMRWVYTRGQSLNILSAIFKAAKLRDAAARVVELDPTNMEARAALAAYYEVLPGIVGGDKTRARQIVEELVTLSPADGYTLLGLQAEQQGLPDSVKVNRWNAALRIDPENQGALLALGLHWIGQDSTRLALSYYERAAVAAPQDPRVWLSYGRAQRRAGGDEEASRYWMEALELDPYYAPARFNLAEYYEEKGERREALRQYSTLALNNPTYKEKDVRQRIRRLSR